MLIVDVDTKEFVVDGIGDGEGVGEWTDTDCAVETGVVVIDSVVVEQTVFGTICQSQAFLSNQLKIELKQKFYFDREFIENFDSSWVWAILYGS